MAKTYLRVIPSFPVVFAICEHKCRFVALLFAVQLQRYLVMLQNSMLLGFEKSLAQLESWSMRKQVLKRVRSPVERTETRAVA
jgi:hypothetical protein